MTHQNEEAERLTIYSALKRILDAQKEHLHPYSSSALTDAYAALRDVRDANTIIANQAAEIERLTKTNAAFTLLTKSQEERISILLQGKAKWDEAAATLQSERDANALLTAEIERLNVEIAARDRHDDYFVQSINEKLKAIQHKDALLRELLESLKSTGDLTKYAWEPSSIFKHFYASASGDYVDLRQFRQHISAAIANIKTELGEV